jgi:hypothetical protein
VEVGNRLGSEFRVVVLDLLERLGPAFVAAPTIVTMPALPPAALAAEQPFYAANPVGDGHSNG